MTQVFREKNGISTAAEIATHLIYKPEAEIPKGFHTFYTHTNIYIHAFSVSFHTKLLQPHQSKRVRKDKQTENAFKEPFITTLLIKERNETILNRLPFQSLNQ